MSLVVANRYARALADVVAEKADYRQTLEELESFGAAYRDVLELREVFGSPAVSLERKLKVLRAIAGRLGASSITTNFFRVLLANYRMPLLPEICEAFQRITDERLGVVRVKVVSAADLSEPEREALRVRFADLTGKRVKLQYEVDGDLLGGVRAQIGSTIYDGSIRGQFARIRQRLAAQ
jgi:F-type H+-transporting ATPase subunit delta